MEYQMFYALHVRFGARRGYWVFSLETRFSIMPCAFIGQQWASVLGLTGTKYQLLFCLDCINILIVAQLSGHASIQLYEYLIGIYVD